MASVFSEEVGPQEVPPRAIYGSDGPIKLRIATGGAGQTGVLKALADSFIKLYQCLPLQVNPNYDSVNSSTGLGPLRIAWLATDTSLSFNALASSSADIAITYHPYAEQIALQQGVAIRREYFWRDAFNLIGPAANPADLPTDGNLSIFELFSLLFQAAVKSESPASHVRFLSRWDKSANNILESRLWTSIGQTPWSEPQSPWYHIHPSFPFEALQEATRLSEYTLIDRGTWCTHRDSLQFQGMKCFKEGAIQWKENPGVLTNGHILSDDCLGNPAHALLSPNAQDLNIANLFLDWMMCTNGGQEVLRRFKVNGEVLHGTSPETTVALDHLQAKM